MIHNNFHKFDQIKYYLLQFIVIFMIKEQSHKKRTKKVQCNIHGIRIRYKCMHSQCTSPYLCGLSGCIDDHFHDNDRVILTKFDSIEWEEKLRQVENAIADKSLEVKQGYLTKIITCFAQSLHKIHYQMNELQHFKQQIRSSANPPLPIECLDRFLTLGTKVQKRINNLRSKIVDEDSYFRNKYSKIAANQPEEIQKPNMTNKSSQIAKKEKDVIDSQNLCNNSFTNSIKQQQIDFKKDSHLKKCLTNLINKIEWQQTQILFSSKSTLVSCQRFHQHLKSRINLLFLFIGENEMIGSYYSVSYPTLVQKNKKDDKSFIFINNKDLNNKFTVFFANKLSQYHLSISERLLICHGNTANNGDGIRTFKRNFESLSYYLPSRSYSYTNQDEQVAYSGVLQIKQFYILQLNLK